jgi:hypothetical protein
MARTGLAPLGRFVELALHGEHLARQVAAGGIVRLSAPRPGRPARLPRVTLPWSNKAFARFHRLRPLMLLVRASQCGEGLPDYSAPLTPSKNSATMSQVHRVSVRRANHVCDAARTLGQGRFT